MATFRCIQSGQTVTFTYQHDIESMKGHSGYVRIDQEAPSEEDSKQITLSPPTPIKRLGRPKKVANHG
jgi:hypothetical protein